MLCRSGACGRAPPGIPVVSYCPPSISSPNHMVRQQYDLVVLVSWHNVRWCGTRCARAVSCHTARTITVYHTAGSTTLPHFATLLVTLCHTGGHTLSMVSCHTNTQPNPHLTQSHAFHKVQTNSNQISIFCQTSQWCFDRSLQKSFSKSFQDFSSKKILFVQDCWQWQGGLWCRLEARQDVALHEPEDMERARGGMESLESPLFQEVLKSFFAARAWGAHSFICL